ncbi:MAG: hypothetical protein FD124_3533 [Alphaproteobacteria bacterium]|nr:MAG: hypothetical protein FD160_3788 [Caulobacteraceae bacterium]TPW02034.1 MAG: hypothetical protein FD124_3533 [Alphaproteobacteria bacterium]
MFNRPLNTTRNRGVLLIQAIFLFVGLLLPEPWVKEYGWWLIFAWFIAVIWWVDKSAARTWSETHEYRERKSKQR